MRLIDLTVLRGSDLVRRVLFKDGLNLILDTPTSEKTKTGNNVGKTTVLRLIDFCLGSNGSDIWEDSEFKTSKNQEVYDFLTGTVPVTVVLTLTRGKSGGGKAHRLERTFASQGTGSSKRRARFVVDDVEIAKLNSYRDEVKRLLFGTDAPKPSLRQLMPKFVRSSPLSMSKTLKFVGTYASDAQYEIVHLFLFGYMDVQILEDRPKLAQRQKNLTRDLQAFTRKRKEGEIEQLLLHLQREIDEIGHSVAFQGEIPEIARHADVVSGLRSHASNLAGQLGQLEGEMASMRLTISELDGEFANIDRAAVEAIYREAQTYIPKLHHDWNSLTDFVQGLRARKRRFIEGQLNAFEAQAGMIREQLRELQGREDAEIGSLSKSPAFNAAIQLRSDLQEKLKQVGSLDQDLKDIRELKQRIAETEENLLETKIKLDENRNRLQERVAIFNKFFSQLSASLYGEEYLLHFEETTRGTIIFELTAVGANVGAGKKMSQTAAFDLAYIQFLDASSINFPTFVCHDGVESIHANQLRALLETANEIDGQLILATLRDKLPQLTKEFVDSNTVLQLSQDEKFFRL